MPHRPFLRTAFIVLAISSLMVGLFLAKSAPGAGTAIAGPPGPNDASSGGDAGNAPHLALLLSAGTGPWRANLTPVGFDADWYRLDRSSASCAQVEVRTNFAGHVTLASSPDLVGAVGQEVSPSAPARSALAAASGSGPFLGVEPFSTLMSTTTDDTGPQNPGYYSFAFTARTHEELDPERDGETPEAGPTSETAAALPIGCTAGRLAASAGDFQDRYAFDVTTPRQLVLSFARAGGDEADARVLRPDGSVYGVLADGDVLTVDAADAGRWAVVVEPTATTTSSLALLRAPTLGIDTTTSTIDYLLGVTESEPQPCRPSC